MGRTGWVAAGFLAVAALASWFTLSAPPREAEPEAEVDGAFEASVKDPPHASSGQDANAVLLARADRVPARGDPQYELDQRFQTDPHDAAAPRVESAVQAAFARDDVASELFKSVSCRKTMCKLVVRMTKARVPSYHRALRELAQAGFSAEPNATLALDERDERDVDLYLSHAGAPTPQP